MLDKGKTVLTLDAGGTSFVFSAMKNNKEIVDSVTLPTQSHDLDSCLGNMVSGFTMIKEKIEKKPDAISFAFPGPANYPKGIIGDLPNFEAFNGGIALGPMLEEKFQIPVFINNDGNLFAYGEALAGILPEINSKLKNSASTKVFKNLLGITIGTGFGAGIVIDKVMLTGDNSSAAEIHSTLNAFNSEWNAEESVGTLAIQREYAEKAGLNLDTTLMPIDIYKIAKGEKSGDRDAAIYSFQKFGFALGISIANAAALIDSIVVIGGGISDGWDIFESALFEGINKKFINSSGEKSDRLPLSVFNLEEKSQEDNFIKGNPKKAIIPGTKKVITYDDTPRIGISKSKLGASRAISLGAYFYAIEKLKEIEKP
jgi:glucokinase